MKCTDGYTLKICCTFVSRVYNLDTIWVKTTKPAISIMYVPNKMKKQLYLSKVCEFKNFSCTNIYLITSPCYVCGKKISDWTIIYARFQSWKWWKIAFGTYMVLKNLELQNVDRLTVLCEFRVYRWQSSAKINNK